MNPLLRSAALAAGLSFVLGCTGLATGPAPTASAATTCTAGTPVAGDYDGDGTPDLAVRVERTVGGDVDSPFSVIPGDGGDRYWVGSGSNGQELVNADLNGDTCADAVIGTTLILGSPDGLDVTTARTLVLPQASHLGAERGLRVTAAALRHDGISQVAVAGWTYDTEDGNLEADHFLDVFTLDTQGEPGTPQLIDLTTREAKGSLVVAASGRSIAVGDGELTVSGKAWAGGVFMFCASATDPLTMDYRTTLTQRSSGVPGTAEAEDYFGGAVAFRDGRLAIGAPGETIGKAVHAGQVQLILWKEGSSTWQTSWKVYRAINQGTKGVPGTNESGDQFGYEVQVTRGLTASGSYDIAISATEKIGRASAGSVTVVNFTTSAARGLTQNTKGVPGTAETGDDFGFGLGVLRTSRTTDTLLIGAPGEQGVLPSPQIGSVIRSDGKKLTSSTRWTSVARFEDHGDTSYEYWGFAFAR